MRALRPAGVIWSLWWERLMADISLEEPAVSTALTERLGAAPAAQTVGQQAGGAAAEPVPWRGFLRNRAVQALAYTHFCNNWCVGSGEGVGAAALACLQWRWHVRCREMPSQLDGCLADF